MQTLIIDHYDSFTYNLFQLVAQIQNVEPIVIAHDSTELKTLSPQYYDNIILSPGPGHPDNPQDFKIGKSLVQHSDKPILGVCLGHQGIFSVFGGQIERAPVPTHGCLSTISHTHDDLYQYIPNPFQVMRYHSLICTGPIPEDLEITARTSDGLIMGLRHKYKPIWGVQYHPESIACEYGQQLLLNFQQLTTRFYEDRGLALTSYRMETGSREQAAGRRIEEPKHRRKEPEHREKSEPKQSWEVVVEKLSCFPNPAGVFKQLFAQKSSAVWLDSSQIIDGFSRFSYMGAIDSPWSYQIIYDATTQITTKIQGDNTSQYTISIFDYLKHRLENIEILAPKAIPFDFHGGFIGYFGYELNQETASITNAKRSQLPDAQWLFLDRFLVLDHQEQVCYLVALSPQGESASHHQSWFQTMRTDLQNIEDPHPTDIVNTNAQGIWVQEQDAYLHSIQNCLDLLVAGETYEICLTNKLRFSCSVDPLNFYLNLRHGHPAPHAAFFKFSDLSIACSSMERFLKIDAQRQIQTKPIKGTMPRGQDPIEDQAFAQALQTEEKFHSEHVMIVDLLRNDLGKVCQIGSVAVAQLMKVETYATLHQLVSLITGQLKPEIDNITSIQHVFPGGSMTGAPKIRTMALLNQIETEARGIYSGSLGYISLNGTLDLNIIIRTAVITPKELSIGAGGAIIALSNPEDEFGEMVLKTKALQKALGIPL